MEEGVCEHASPIIKGRALSHVLINMVRGENRFDKYFGAIIESSSHNPSLELSRDP